SMYKLTFFLFSIVAILSFILPITHDYLAYTKIWNSFLLTHHPYSTANEFNGNSYGPLFIPLAFLFKIHPNLPHFLFILLWFAIGIFILRMREYSELTSKRKIIIWSLLFLNPFYYVVFLVFGINEIFMTFFT